MSHIDDLKHEMQTGVINGDCCEVLTNFGSGSVDLVVTDPPYLVDYHSTDGRSYPNDKDGAFLTEAFIEIYRVLRNDAFCVSFYGWPRAEEFLSAWKGAGFRPVGHIIWTKDYASNRGAVNYRHEQAYVLAKGNADPQSVIDDVLPWGKPTGNVLHPTQKPVAAIDPLIRAFSRDGEIVLDPFCGSGTTLVSARDAGRQYIGIEMVKEYADNARDRLRTERYEYRQQFGRYDFQSRFRQSDWSHPTERREQDFRSSWSKSSYSPHRPWLPYDEWRRTQGYGDRSRYRR